MGSEERKGRRERFSEKVHSLLKMGRGSREYDSPLSQSPTGSSDGSSGISLMSPEGEISPLTLMLLYSLRDDVDALRGLLQIHRDLELPKTKDYDDRTALHIAATHGCVSAARVLIENGADVNAQDRWKNSPLADAKASNHKNTEKMVKLLELHGGKLLGHHGQELEKMEPPRPLKSDWEIDPEEIDLINSTPIGKGSFGEIRKTSWRGTPVAVKTILPALSNDKLVVQDFRHEVELLVKVRHPNIVQFLGAVTKRPPLMLITEYLQGGDLHVVLKNKGPLSASTIVHYALDIARGLAYLHNGPNTIIHRDLKPRNVLLGENNQLKVGDFGLSKLIRGKNMHDIYKMTGETGSYRYMAPEVFEHRPYDMSVDIFSFAVIIFEMFEGSPPFTNLDAYEAARAAARHDRPPFACKYYPAGMTKLIEECWDHIPTARPQWNDIIARLEKMSADLLTQPKEHHTWRFTTAHSNHSS